MNLDDINQTPEQNDEIIDPIMQDDEIDPIVQDDEIDPIMQDDEPDLSAVTSGAPRPVREKKKKNLKKEVIGWVVTITAAIIIAVLVRSFVFIMVQVDGSSMLDTLHNENRLFVWRAGYLFDAPERGDVIICHYPDAEGNYDGNINYVKRVIGLPGDTVSIIAGEVYINNQKLEEPYVTPKRVNAKEYMAPITLGEEDYFVMGDNRSNSRDSRYVGAIKREQIVGKAIWKVYPFNEMGSVE